MKLFVWNDVWGLTSQWHNGGGLVVIADSLERARELIKGATPGAGGGNADCEALTKDPDLVRECEGPEHISIHQDAGCC